MPDPKICRQCRKSWNSLLDNDLDPILGWTCPALVDAIGIQSKARNWIDIDQKPAKGCYKLFEQLIARTKKDA
jgi:hypothetical protein